MISLPHKPSRSFALKNMMYCSITRPCREARNCGSAQLLKKVKADLSGSKSQPSPFCKREYTVLFSLASSTFVIDISIPQKRIESMGNGESIEDEDGFYKPTPLVEKLRGLARGTASLPAPSIVHEDDFEDWQQHANIRTTVMPASTTLPFDFFQPSFTCHLPPQS